MKAEMLLAGTNGAQAQLVPLSTFTVTQTETETETETQTQTSSQSNGQSNKASLSPDRALAMAKDTTSPSFSHSSLASSGSASSGLETDAGTGTETEEEWNEALTPEMMAGSLLLEPGVQVAVPGANPLSPPKVVGKVLDKDGKANGRAVNGAGTGMDKSMIIQ